MTSTCRVCINPRCAEIELALSRKVSLKQISRKFGPSVYSIYRHSKHMPPQVMASLIATGTPTVIDLEALKKSESEGLLQTLVAQRGRLFMVLSAAEESGDLRAAAAIHGRINDNVNTVAKLLGEISTHSQTTVNQLLVAPEWLALRSSLLKALRPFPDARKAVAAVIKEIEGQEPHQTGLPKLERADVQP